MWECGVLSAACSDVYTPPSYSRRCTIEQADASSQSKDTAFDR